MRPPSYTRSVVDRNVVMWYMTVLVHCFDWSQQKALVSVWSRASVYKSEMRYEVKAVFGSLSETTLAYIQAVARVNWHSMYVR